MAIIYNKTKDERNIGCKDPVSGVRKLFNPGSNELPDEDWEKLEPHLTLQLKTKSLVKDPSVVVKEVPEKIDGKETGKNVLSVKGKAFKDFSTSEASKLVAECMNTQDLAKWKKETKADSLKSEINDRIKELKDPGKEEE